MFGKIVDIKRIVNTIYQQLPKLWMKKFCPPKSDKLCDWSTFSSEEASGSGLSCDNCKIFQNMLNMKFDDDKDNGEDLEDQQV
ncbi:unnamed protein product [Rhizophagus irregularis]|uniref:Uncharacterized protein n=1 Tax=Rhizophagus irregularis TaxID=588596 RepID=A0A915YS77_9GLOM|nr:unnamed protein product [Rhizophagus irregularis]CAB5326594.1 unnamed protein product [Rhizophagus irregularis]